jgi:hypothetical protein
MWISIYLYSRRRRYWMGHLMNRSSSEKGATKSFLLTEDHFLEENNIFFYSIPRSGDSQVPSLLKRKSSTAVPVLSCFCFDCVRENAWRWWIKMRDETLFLVFSNWPRNSLKDNTETRAHQQSSVVHRTARPDRFRIVWRFKREWMLGAQQNSLRADVGGWNPLSYIILAGQWKIWVAVVEA